MYESIPLGAFKDDLTGPSRFLYGFIGKSSEEEEFYFVAFQEGKYYIELLRVPQKKLKNPFLTATLSQVNITPIHWLQARANTLVQNLDCPKIHKWNIQYDNNVIYNRGNVRFAHLYSSTNILI